MARRGAVLIELDREVQREARMDLADIFTLQGREGYRRLERAALERVVAKGRPAAIAAGGGVVAESVTFTLLLDACVTVWLRASPEEHMRRMLEQGGTRPMRGNRRATGDLRTILASREPLHARADQVVDTSGRTPEQSLRDLLAVLRPAVGAAVSPR